MFEYWASAFNSTYLLFFIPAIILSLYAQMKVNSTYHKFEQVKSRRGVTAAQVARAILDKHGLYDVSVGMIPGKLTDHYNPQTKQLNLSQATFQSTSVAAIGVAAHEAGHAVQHAEGYVPLKLRSFFVPIASIGSNMAIPLVILGLIFSSMSFLIDVGIILFSVVVAFYIITLPVEFNASSCAIEVLDAGAFLDADEISGAKKVLSAAALTYLAAAAVALANLIRLLALRRDD